MVYWIFFISLVSELMEKKSALLDFNIDKILKVLVLKKKVVY